MRVRQCITSHLLGAPERHRFEYLLAAGSIALGVGILSPAFVDTSLWVMVAIGVCIGATAGIGNYGLGSALLTTALYVAAVGQTQLLRPRLPIAVIAPRLLFLLVIVTVVVAVPSYVAGFGFRRWLQGDD